MAKLVFGLNQSLDGYVDHQEFAPGPSLFRHFTEQVRDLAGSVYGRRMYEVVRQPFSEMRLLGRRDLDRVANINLEYAVCGNGISNDCACC
jgi:hypothetical protein